MTHEMTFVFPTLVGVFPIDWSLEYLMIRLPHARGGVSPEGCIRYLTTTSSPRSWGCFQDQNGATMMTEVFPTLVGVFLKNLT